MEGGNNNNSVGLGGIGGGSGGSTGPGGGGGNFHEIEDLEFSSIYQKLGLLSTEMEQNILELHEKNQQPEIQRSLQWMKNESFKDLTPEVDYLTRLSRYYVGEIQQTLRYRGSSNIHSNSLNNDEQISLIDQFIPHYIYDGTAEQIIGLQALKTNVFWTRLSTGIFSLISFIIMSTVPFISHKRVSPHMLFHNDCPYKNDAEYKVGSFDFLSYQYIIGLGAATFLYSTLFAVYYLLPVDENSRKYIPGLRTITQQFLSTADINAYHHIISDTIKQSSKSIEPIVDGGLFFMVLIAAIRAAVAVESPQAFGSETIPYQYYYSLNTFTRTFENTDPSCIDEGMVKLIRAATAMTFLAALCIGFSFQISLRSYLKEQKQKQKELNHPNHALTFVIKSPLDQEEGVRL